MTNHSGAFRNLARYTTPEVVLVINNFLTNNTSIYGQVRVNVISQLRLPIKLHTQARTHTHTHAHTRTHTLRYIVVSIIGIMKLTVSCHSSTDDHNDHHENNIFGH